MRKNPRKLRFLDFLKAVDLKKYTIQEAWESAQFDEFRNSFRNACPSCEKKKLCMGGCPIRPEIVLCNKKHKTIG